MKNKLTQSIPALLALLAIGFSYFSQWCTAEGHVCNRTVLDQMIPYVTYPLNFFALYVLPITLILIFVSRSTFNSWLKLAVWALPVSLIYIATTHVTSSAFMDLFPFYRDDAARLAGTAFSLASLLLVIWKYVSSHRVSVNV
jgi:hypothetical protein